VFDRTVEENPAIGVLDEEEEPNTGVPTDG
jgi:hypothetical protein